MGSEFGWDVDEEGMVIIRQTSGWKIIPAFGMSVVVRLEHEGPTPTGEVSRAALQFAMPADAAILFAKEVFETAKGILDQRVPPKPS